jgi:tetratricopeptide (TPR) repeat protein
MIEAPNSANSPDRSEGSGNLDLALFLDQILEGTLFSREDRKRGNFRFPSEISTPCPASADWIELATRELKGPRAQAVQAHAALCSECLTRLRASQKILDQDATVEEIAELSHLASTSSQWQHQIAVELAQTPFGKSRKRRLFYGWISAGATAALTLMFVSVLWHRNHAPEQLLAAAYGQDRTFDLRVAGAPYAPVTPEQEVRGMRSTQDGSPLQAAHREIDEKLERTPSDPRWLELKARAATLDEQYDDAIAILDKLLTAGPPTGSLLLDAGSAYFLRGTVTGSEADRAKALDYLRQADRAAPANPVILFDEAIMMEDHGQLMQAAETWNRYLKCEPDPQWRADGQRRLELLEERIHRDKMKEAPLRNSKAP